MIRKIICMLTLAAAFVGCTKDEWPDQPDWSRIPDPSIPVDDGFMKPAASLPIAEVLPNAVRRTTRWRRWSTP